MDCLPLQLYRAAVLLSTHFNRQQLLQTSSGAGGKPRGLPQRQEPAARAGRAPG